MRWLVLVGALAGCGGGGSKCGPGEGVVDRVIDGDTVVLDSGVKIRYLMINAPETTNGHNDCYGQNATEQNSALVLGKTIKLDYDVECEDMFGRTLAFVSVDGTDVNKLMVQRGFACVLHIPPNGDDVADEYNALQAEAKAAGAGLWGACDPIPCN